MSVVFNSKMMRYSVFDLVTLASPLSRFQQITVNYLHLDFKPSTSLTPCSPGLDWTRVLEQITFCLSRLPFHDTEYVFIYSELINSVLTS